VEGNWIRSGYQTQLFSGLTQVRNWRFWLFITRDSWISNPAAGIERRDMGERRAFTLAHSLMLFVFYVHFASECYEGRLNCWY